jgi:Uma2 family endonuclease
VIWSESKPDRLDIYWLVEVSNSTLSYDLGEKARIYERDRTQDYWVIDVVGKQLWVHREPNDQKYGSLKQLTSGTISPLAMPDVSLQIERLVI